MIHPDCQDFVTCVEALLERRRVDGPRPGEPFGWGPRAWNRTELEDTVYSSYKQMRKGRVTRPPRRETVMEIAGYLDCTLEERNRLLIAAGAAPIAPYLTGAALDEALRVAGAVAAALPIPAVIINRDWHIHFLNEPILRLFGVTPEQLAAVAPHQFNVLHLLFDPALPLHPLLIQNQASWTRMVRQTIFGFKAANQLSQFEPWYAELVTQLLALPEFAEQWGSVAADQPLAADPGEPAVRLEILAQPPAGPPQRAWVRPLLISVGYFQFDFPQIVGFVPADEPSQAILADILSLAPALG
jgi:PAS domain-containing protein